MKPEAKATPVPEAKQASACPRCHGGPVVPHRLSPGGRAFVVGLLILLLTGMYFDSSNQGTYSFISALVTIVTFLRLSGGTCSSCNADVRESLRGGWV